MGLPHTTNTCHTRYGIKYKAGVGSTHLYTLTRDHGCGHIHSLCHCTKLLPNHTKVMVRCNYLEMKGFYIDLAQDQPSTRINCCLQVTKSFTHCTELRETHPVL